MRGALGVRLVADRLSRPRLRERNERVEPRRPSVGIGELQAAHALLLQELGQAALARELLGELVNVVVGRRHLHHPLARSEHSLDAPELHQWLLAVQPKSLSRIQGMYN